MGKQIEWFTYGPEFSSDIEFVRLGLEAAGILFLLAALKTSMSFLLLSKNRTANLDTFCIRYLLTGAPETGCARNPYSVRIKQGGPHAIFASVFLVLKR